VIKMALGEALGGRMSTVTCNRRSNKAQSHFQRNPLGRPPFNLRLRYSFLTDPWRECSSLVPHRRSKTLAAKHQSLVRPYTNQTSPNFEGQPWKEQHSSPSHRKQLISNQFRTQSSPAASRSVKPGQTQSNQLRGRSNHRQPRRPDSATNRRTRAANSPAPLSCSSER
jgi:hypothetical protein